MRHLAAQAFRPHRLHQLPETLEFFRQFGAQTVGADFELKRHLRPGCTHHQPLFKRPAGQAERQPGNAHTGDTQIKRGFRRIDLDFRIEVKCLFRPAQRFLLELESAA